METRTIETTWEVWTYDVWGNAEDGYEVNDRYCRERAFELTLAVEVCNAGTPQEFECASISDAQVKELWGDGVETDGNGDDLHYYFERCKDGKPVGEMFCVSHESLSPIRVKQSE
jgi:hypothetical protein